MFFNLDTVIRLHSLHCELKLTPVSYNPPLSEPSDPFSVFVTPRGFPQLKEGEDFLFRCLVTDPSVKNITFQSEGSIRERGLTLPPGMNVTFDPRRGALIQNLQRSFNGLYLCSGWKDGRQFKSTSVNLIVVPSEYTCLSAHLYTCLFTCLFTCTPVCPSACIQSSVTLPQCLSVRMNSFVWREKGLRSPVWPVTPPTHTT